MKKRKIMVTIEMLTDIRLKEFNKFNVQHMFDDHFADAWKDEAIVVHQVKVQAIRPEK